MTVKIKPGGAVQTVVASDLQQWSVTFPERKASTQPITLNITLSHKHSRTARDILIGDVWHLTGSTQLTSEWAYDRRIKEAKPRATLPFVREYRWRTAASSFATPRKRRFETGGGRYRTYWSAADFTQETTGVTMFAYEFAKALNRKGIPQGFMTMSSVQGGRNRQFASPLSWTSFDGVRNAKYPAFKTRLDELFLQYPNSPVARKAAAAHVTEVKALVQDLIKAGQHGADSSTFASPGLYRAGSKRNGGQRHHPHLRLQLEHQPAHANGCGRCNLDSIRPQHRRKSRRLRRRVGGLSQEPPPDLRSKRDSVPLRPTLRRHR